MGHKHKKCGFLGNLFEDDLIIWLIIGIIILFLFFDGGCRSGTTIL